MEGNKHEYYNLIVELMGDTSKKLEGKLTAKSEWEIASVYDLIENEEGYCEFRIKPREFIKGHWYPCYETKRRVSVKVSSGECFYASSDFSSIAFYEDEFVFIGKSLGEIKFDE